MIRVASGTHPAREVHTAPNFQVLSPPKLLTPLRVVENEIRKAGRSGLYLVGNGSDSGKRAWQACEGVAATSPLFVWADRYSRLWETITSASETVPPSGKLRTVHWELLVRHLPMEEFKWVLAQVNPSGWSGSGKPPPAGYGPMVMEAKRGGRIHLLGIGNWVGTSDDADSCGVEGSGPGLAGKIGGDP